MVVTRMKKIINGICILVLCLGLGGCSSTLMFFQPEVVEESETSSVSNSDYIKDILDGNTFESEFIGIRLEAPSGYIMVTQEELDALISQMYDVLEEEISDKTLDYAKSVSIYEMLITSPSGLPNIIVASEELPLANMDVDMYLEQFKGGMSMGTFASMAVIEEDITEEIAGQEYKGFLAIATAGEAEIYQKALCRKVGSHVISMMITYLPGTEAEVEELLNAFQPY